MLAYVDLLAAPSETLTVMITNPLEKHWDRCFSKLVMWRAAMPNRWQIGKMYRGTKPALLTVPADKGSRMGILCVSIADGYCTVLQCLRIHRDAIGGAYLILPTVTPTNGRLLVVEDIELLLEGRVDFFRNLRHAVLLNERQNGGLDRC